MSDSRYPTYPPNSRDDDERVRRATTTDMLQRALQSLQGGTGGALTPEQLSDIAQRAGLTQPGQLADLSRLLGANTPGGGAELTGEAQHIVFALHDIECALPAETVQGVERLADVTPVPNTVPWVIGVVHVRGAIHSVVDLRGFFGLPPTSLTQRSRLLLVTVREMTIGLVVDAVTEMRALTGDGAPAYGGATPDWALPYVERTTTLEGRSVLLLDPEKLLFAEKLHRYRADLN
ncbi:MAG: chemotaxis protein CheW [Ktedonobacterales bacterium]